MIRPPKVRATPTPTRAKRQRRRRQLVGIFVGGVRKFLHPPSPSAIERNLPSSSRDNGTIDGGGNRARNNGEPARCIVAACS